MSETNERGFGEVEANHVENALRTGFAQIKNPDQIEAIKKATISFAEGKI